MTTTMCRGHDGGERDEAFSEQLTIRTEIIMTTQEMHPYLRRRSVKSAVRTITGLLGIALLGYFATALVEHAMPSLNVTSGFALESRMTNPEAATAMADEQSTNGVATASVRASPSPTSTPAPEVGYFPKQHVNQATTIEEPSPTF